MRVALRPALPPPRGPRPATWLPFQRKFAEASWSPHLFLDDQLHVHVVVSTPALHGALDRVLPRIRRSFDLIVMSAFVKTEVPPLVAKTADHQAVNRAIAGQLRSMLRCNSQPQHFAGVSPDYSRLRIGHTKRVVARRNDLDEPPLRQVGPDSNAAQ